MISARLNEVTEFVLDGTHASPARTETGVPVLSAQNVNHGVLNYETARYTSASEYEAFARRLSLRIGDVLLTIVGTIGRAAVIDHVRPLVFQRSVAVLRPCEDKLDPRFLYHVSQSEAFQAQLSRASNQSSQAGVYLGKLKELRVPLPPLPEQRRIARILDKADALRAKRREALAKLDTLTPSLFVDMFGDPVTNPKGWPVVTVDDVAEVQGGLQITSARRALPIEVPYLRVGNVYRGALDLSEIKSMRATEAEIARTKLESDDLMIVEGHGNPGEIGRAALWDGSIPECVHQNHLIRARFARERIEPMYACEYLNSPGGRRFLLRAGKTTSGLNTISVSEVRATPISVPPIDAQRQFTKLVARLRRTADTFRASLQEIDSLFSTLHDRAFRSAL